MYVHSSFLTLRLTPLNILFYFTITMIAVLIGFCTSNKTGKVGVKNVGRDWFIPLQSSLQAVSSYKPNHATAPKDTLNIIFVAPQQTDNLVLHPNNSPIIKLPHTLHIVC